MSEINKSISKGEWVSKKNVYIYVCVHVCIFFFFSFLATFVTYGSSQARD